MRCVDLTRDTSISAVKNDRALNPLKADLNPICHFMALLEAHHIFHVSRIMVIH